MEAWRDRVRGIAERGEGVARSLTSRVVPTVGNKAQPTRINLPPCFVLTEMVCVPHNGSNTGTRMSGTLYFGDNLDVLREHVRDESVDLIYLDPPFNSAASYNVLFKTTDGTRSQSQLTAFEDTWSWAEASAMAFDDVMRSGHTEVSTVLRAMQQILGESDLMAYLAMMTVRLVELRRVLRSDGSIYLHCDPAASHYLKLILDGLFGPGCYLNEIIWKRTSAHSSAKRYGPVHDVILYYAKRPDTFVWNQAYQPYTQDYLNTFFDQQDADGRRWKRGDLTGAGVRYGETGMVWRGLDVTAKGRHWAYRPSDMEQFDAQGRVHWPKKEGGMPRLKQYPEDSKGIPLQDVWTDIRPLHNMSAERLGYPTQKPVSLLERIISSSSNKGQTVLDPFCGCGTTVHAAQKLGRRWLGIDITPLAVNLIARRLKEAFAGIEFAVRGIPRDMDGARELAARDKHLFQLWACDLVDAQPERDGKKGADGGIDGRIYFKPDGRTTKAAIVSVKGGGNVGVAQIRDLRGTIERLGEPMGVFLTLTPPTGPMVREAASAGIYDTGFQRVPRIQILTAEQLLTGDKPRIPFGHNVSYRKAEREKENRQIGLEL